MGLFGNRGSHPSTARQQEPGEWTELAPVDHQFAVMDVLDAFEAHDSAALARLTAPERADQLRARQILEAYLTAMWEAPKQRAVREGSDPDEAHPANDPAFSCVAGLLDLAHALVAQVELAQNAAGDDADDDPSPALLPIDRFEPLPDV